MVKRTSKVEKKIAVKGLNVVKQETIEFNIAGLNLAKKKQIEVDATELRMLQKNPELLKHMKGKLVKEVKVKDDEN